MKKFRRTSATLASAALALAASLAMQMAHADARSPQEHEALFDQLVELTMQREAWAPKKNALFAARYPKDFAPLRKVFRDADSDEALFYALVRFSNERHDRHLRVRTVEGGLAPTPTPRREAPIRLLPDFGQKPTGFFVADVPVDADAYGENVTRLQAGHRVVSINGRSTEEYLRLVTPYHRGSTPEGLVWKVAQAIPRHDDVLPQALLTPALTLDLLDQEGHAYQVTLPYLDPGEVRLAGADARHYPGFERRLDFVSFDFYVSTDERDVVLFDWYGFREDLTEAMDQVMLYAEAQGLLEHDVIWDGTRSRGGSRGAYALRRLQPRPFRTTLGNLRISDVTPDFVSHCLRRHMQGERPCNGVGVDEPGNLWLTQWLTDHVIPAVRQRQAYTTNVPFKSADLPPHSDGILQPAPVHFRGKMVCWLSPHGGSHLDQFAAMIADNALCPILGMAAGGYSNTWEHTEVLRWDDGEPIASFMWNVGHTIRPNGEILEGNPAAVTHPLPVTAATFDTYYEHLLELSLALLDEHAE